MSSASAWEKKFAALEAWKARHGGEDPPCKATFEGLNLGMWCSKQRQARKKHKLLARRAERLQSVGFTWNPDRRRKRKRCHHDDEDQTMHRINSGQDMEMVEENIGGFIFKAFGAVRGRRRH